MKCIRILKTHFKSTIVCKFIYFAQYWIIFTIKFKYLNIWDFICLWYDKIKTKSKFVFLRDFFGYFFVLIKERKWILFWESMKDWDINNGLIFQNGFPFKWSLWESLVRWLISEEFLCILGHQFVVSSWGGATSASLALVPPFESGAHPLPVGWPLPLLFPLPFPMPVSLFLAKSDLLSWEEMLSFGACHRCFRCCCCLFAWRRRKVKACIASIKLDAFSTRFVCQALSI